MDAEALSTLIVKALQNHGLTIQNCIAQCYDGAAVMSGEHTGVQSQIKNSRSLHFCPLSCTPIIPCAGFNRQKKLFL